jgi:uncharacterized repeat protein (TIGR01451 family)
LKNISRAPSKKGAGEIKRSKFLTPFMIFLLIGIITIGAIQPVMAAPTCVITHITTPGIAEGEPTHPGDADGFPDGTIVGNADPGDFQLVVNCSIDSPITGVSVFLNNTDHDPIDDHPDREDPDVTDFIIDNDNPQNYASLGIGNHIFFWSLDKDQSVCLVLNSEQYQVNLSWTGPSPGFALSELINITADKSTSIAQNDLDAVQTTPLSTSINPGETFRACIKWEQQSSSLDALATEIYYNGTMLRLYNFTLYYYDTNGTDPGDITSGIPSGYKAYWANDTFLNTTQMNIYPLSSADYWIGCWDFIALEPGTDTMEIYSQTKLSPTANWKIGPSNTEIDITVVFPKITIIKNSIPDHIQNFNFTGNFTTGNFTLDDDGTENNPENSSRTFEVNPGTYNVTEFVPGGWDLTDITIQEESPTNSSYSLYDANATLVVDVGEWINVTFTNTKRGKITVIKDAIPDDAQDFTFDGNFTTGSFTLDDDGGENNPENSSRTFEVNPGTYNVSETVPSGWELNDITIVEGTSDSSTDINNKNATLVVSAGESVTVTFENNMRGKIRVIKDAVPDDPQTFTFDGNVTSGTFNLVDNGGVNYQDFDVNVGVYNVTEIVPSGWELTDITIQEESPTNSTTSMVLHRALLVVDPGEWVNVTFTNIKGGKIRVIKDAVPDDPQTFTFDGNVTSGTFNLVDNGGVNYQDFDVNVGVYNVTEIVPSGWALTNIAIQDNTGGSSFSLTGHNATLDVAVGEWVNVTFTNNEPGIEITKSLTSSDPTTVGSTVTFDIVVTNTGGTTLTDVDVSDTFDTAYLDFVPPASPAQTSYDETLGTINWDNIEGNAPGGTFDPSESITITVTFTATASTPDADRADNCASVDAESDTVSDGPECDDVEINEPGIEITKSLTSSDPTTVGSTVTFDIVVTNTGGTTLTDVDVSDTFDTAYLDFVPPASPAQTSYDETLGTINWDNIEGNAPGGTFDPSESITITVTFTATASTPDADRADNCASVDAESDTVSDGPECDDVAIYIDYGDAPDSYHTLLASDGARHIPGGVWMGTNVDTEPDGQPNPAANGDDINGIPDDEDGVIFPSLPFLVGTTGSLQIIVGGTVSSGTPAYVYGWIDWNQDGVWATSENVIGQQITTTGTLTFTFPVPGYAISGSTYGRFRIGYVENEVNSVTGEASNGEVEDHLLDPAVARFPPPPRPTAVGGFFVPVNKLTILAPYLAMMISAILASSILAFRKKYRN